MQSVVHAIFFIFHATESKPHNLPYRYAMSSFSSKLTDKTDGSGTQADIKSTATNAKAKASKCRTARGRKGQHDSSSMFTGSSDSPSVVKRWMYWDERDKRYFEPTEMTDETWQARISPGSNSGVSDVTYRFIYCHPQNNIKVPVRFARSSQTSEKKSERSQEVDAATTSSTMSDVTSWIAKSAQRDPPVTLPVAGLFELLGSEKLRMDAALVLQESAEDRWLEFVKTMGSRYFCPGRDHVCSHINTVPLGGQHILIGINRAKHDRRLISLLFTLRVRDGINQGSALHGRLLQSKQRQWDSHALQNSAVDWISSVEQPLGKINPGAFEHAKIFMNEEKTAGWWIGRTEYSLDAKE